MLTWEIRQTILMIRFSNGANANKNVTELTQYKATDRKILNVLDPE